MIEKKNKLGLINIKIENIDGTESFYSVSDTGDILDAITTNAKDLGYLSRYARLRFRTASSIENLLSFLLKEDEKEYRRLLKAVQDEYPMYKLSNGRLIKDQKFKYLNDEFAKMQEVLINMIPYSELLKTGINTRIEEEAANAMKILTDEFNEISEKLERKAEETDLFKVKTEIGMIRKIAFRHKK